MADNWFVEYEGKRGGKWITRPMSEEATRAKFAELGDKMYALLLEQKGSLGAFGPMRQVQARSALAEIRMYEGVLKDHIKRQKGTDKAIAACKDKIKELKKRIA